MLGVLTLTVGFPYVLLAATAPMLQDWFARRFPRSLAVPALRAVERRDRCSRSASIRSTSSATWICARRPSSGPPASPRSVLVCAWCAPSMRDDRADASRRRRSTTRPAGLVDRTLWILLPAFGSGLLVATTSSLTQDVAAVPLIWIVPLALYLVTFIPAFGGLVLAVGLGLGAGHPAGDGDHLANSDSETTILLQGIALVAAFTAAAMVCHGELAQLQARAARLTAFYLAISIGGSPGAAFVTLVAPLLFNWYLELPLLFMLAAGRAARRSAAGDCARAPTGPGRHRAVVACAGALVVTGAIALRPLQREGLVASARGYYGMLRVFDEGHAEKRMQRKLWHGRIVHGVQFLVPPELGRKAGVVLRARQRHRARRSASIRGAISAQPLKIGVVGLGSGTVAALGQPFDHIRFFEMDPLVVEFESVFHVPQGLAGANRHRDSATRGSRSSGRWSPSRITTPTTSSRSTRSPATRFQSTCSRARPSAIYEQALRPDGILAVHISNRYLNLRPVVQRRTDATGLADPRNRPGLRRARRRDWQHLAARHPQRAFLDRTRPLARDRPRRDGTVVWTDAFSSLLTIWK